MTRLMNNVYSQLNVTNRLQMIFIFNCHCLKKRFLAIIKAVYRLLSQNLHFILIDLELT